MSTRQPSTDSTHNLPAHDLDSRWLHTFLAVAKWGRVSAAAKALHLSQPAVTAQLQKLEEASKQTLFKRLPRGVELTDAGKLLHGYAARVEDLLKEAQHALTPAGRVAGELEIAVSTTIAETIVPDLLATFGDAMPDVTLAVRVGNTAEVTELVRTRKIPLGLVEGLKRAPGVRMRPFLDDELVPCISQNAPPSWRGLSTVEDLCQVPIALREVGSGSRAVVVKAISKALGQRRARHPRDLMLGCNALVMGAVRKGLGVGFLSKRLIATAQPGRVVELSLRGLHIPRSFSIALPAGQTSELAKHLLRHLERTRD